MNYCIFTDNHRLTESAHPFKKLIKKQFNHFQMYLISNIFKTLFKETPPKKWIGFVSGACNALLSNDQKQQIQPYNSVLGQVVENTDFKKLHQFADFLHERSLHAGLEWKGLSTFKIMETRWLDPLLNYVVSYIDLISSVYEKLPKSTEIITLTQNSIIEKIAFELAQKKGLLVNQSRSWQSKILSVMQQLDEKSKTKQAYQNIVSFWLKLTPNKATHTAVPQKKKKRILFVGYKERTLRRFEVLIPTLLELDVEILLLSNLRGHSSQVDQLVGGFQKQGVLTFWDSDFFSKNEIKTLLSQVQKINSNAVREFFSKPFEFFYQDLDLVEYAHPLLHDVATAGNLASAIYSEASERVLNMLDPDLIVHFEEWELNRALAMRSQIKNIPSIAYYTMSPMGYCGLLRRLPENLATSGSFLAKAFSVDGGYPKEKISIIGDPLADKFLKIKTNEAKKEILNKYSLDVQKPFVLLLTTFPDENIHFADLERFYRSCCHACKNLGADLLIKVHPQQNPNEIKSMFIGLGLKNINLFHQEDLLLLATAADLSVVTATSATSQILMVGTPVVSIQPSSIQNILESVYEYKSGAKIPVINLGEDPTPIFKSLLFDKDIRLKQIQNGYEYITKHVGPLDGNTSKRFSEYLTQFLV